VAHKRSISFNLVKFRALLAYSAYTADATLSFLFSLSADLLSDRRTLRFFVSAV